jgi:hypothetical protein
MIIRAVFHWVSSCTKLRVIGLSLLMLFSGVSLVMSSSTQLIQKTNTPLPTNLDGRILFAPMWGFTTYIIDATGAVNHTWSSNYLPGVAVWWVGDGSILRTLRMGGGPGLGAGGGVQKIRWDGTILWDYRCNTNACFSHHDVQSLPNGDVLLIAWEAKTRDEAIAAGKNPNLVTTEGMMPDQIIEVKPTGPTTGEIVWEWHVWDHLVQDYDPFKANYGVVADYPELIDVNYAPSFGTDWLHTNSIDYNAGLDQILLSVHNFNEIWVIDHSTTTKEAAGHSGGQSGKGGDLLYRWGNPAAYQRGTSDDEKLFSQHDATWIDENCPGAGNILVFNNGGNRPDGKYSSVDEIVPPVNSTGAYSLDSGSAYGPIEPIWKYTANPPTDFYANRFSGAQRLPDGNTLICNAETGYFFEVTPDGAPIWEYTSPYPTPLTNQLFKIVYIPPEEPPNGPDLKCTGSLSWSDIRPGATVTGSFQVQNIGAPGSLLNWTINTSLLSWGVWMFTPTSGVDLLPKTGKITVQVSVVVPDETNTEFEGYIRVENQNDAHDFDVIPVSLITPFEKVSVQMNLSFQPLFLLKFRQGILEKTLS